MKTIKIGTSNVKNGCLETLYDKLFFDLRNEFEFIYSEDPNFLFVSDVNDNVDYLKKDCVLIFFSSENMHPNFELFDYCIGYNSELYFGDRYCFYLWCVNGIKDYLSPDLKFKKLTRNEAIKALESKDLFCDFIYNHDNKNLKRKHYLDLLNKYKKVSNGGRLYNSERQNDGKSFDYRSKNELQKRCKFSIIVESCEYSGGLVTEKIFHAILNNTIPIYYGEKEIEKYVNPKRFIDAKKYNDDELIDLVMKIDNDDSLFLDYISQSALVDENFFLKSQERLTSFLRNIFNQNPHDAVRKPSNEFSSRWYRNKLIKSYELYNAGVLKTFRHLIKLVFKKIRQKFSNIFSKRKKRKGDFCNH